MNVSCNSMSEFQKVLTGGNLPKVRVQEWFYPFFSTWYSVDCIPQNEIRLVKSERVLTSVSRDEGL